MHNTPEDVAKAILKYAKENFPDGFTLRELYESMNGKILYGKELEKFNNWTEELVRVSKAIKEKGRKLTPEELEEARSIKQ